MEQNDYYHILELLPSATPDEIKRSYRRLAQAYHPDKNADDPYAAAHFAIVKEAYEVLTDPAKKSLYLQERWLAKSNGRATDTDPHTPVSFLKKMLAKERSVARLDSNRLNRDGLYDELTNLFSGDVVEMLNRFGDEGINSEIVRLAIHSSAPLNGPHQQQFYGRLGKILMEPEQQHALEKSMRQSFKSARWERIKIWLLLFIVTAICILIFMVGR